MQFLLTFDLVKHTVDIIEASNDNSQTNGRTFLLGIDSTNYQLVY